MVSGPPHSFTWTAIIYFSNIYWAPCMCQRLAMSKKQCHCSHGSFILVVEGNKCISKWCHIMTYAVKNIKQVNGIVKVGNRGLLYNGWWVKGTPRGVTFKLRPELWGRGRCVEIKGTGAWSRGNNRCKAHVPCLKEERGRMQLASREQRREWKVMRSGETSRARSEI